MCVPIKNIEGDRTLLLGDANGNVTVTDDQGATLVFNPEDATDLLLDLAEHISKATGK